LQREGFNQLPPFLVDVMLKRVHSQTIHSLLGNKLKYYNRSDSVSDSYLGLQYWRLDFKRDDSSLEILPKQIGDASANKTPENLKTDSSLDAIIGRDFGVVSATQ